MVQFVIYQKSWIKWVGVDMWCICVLIFAQPHDCFVALLHPVFYRCCSKVQSFEFNSFPLVCCWIFSLYINVYHFYSTRVSNELGAGFPERARASVYAATCLSIAEAIIACTFLLSMGNIVGYAFSNEEEVVDYLRELIPFVCLLLAMDCIQAVLSGLAPAPLFSALSSILFGVNFAHISNYTHIYLIR